MYLKLNSKITFLCSVDLQSGFLIVPWHHCRLLFMKHKRLQFYFHVKTGKILTHIQICIDQSFSFHFQVDIYLCNSSIYEINTICFS